MSSYQPSLFAPKDSPLDPWVVLLGDPRWDSAISELQSAGHFGFDIETYGKDKEEALDPFRNTIRLIQVGLPSGLSIVCDLGGALDDRIKINLDPRVLRFLSALREALRNRYQFVIGHNLVFDLLTVMVKFQMIGRSVRDVMLCSKVYWAGVGVRPGATCPQCRVAVFWKRPKGKTALTYDQLVEAINRDPSARCSCGGIPLPTERLSHGLKAIAERCGLSVDKTEQASDWAGRLSNQQYNYASNDSLVPISIWKYLRPKIISEGLIITTLAECEACPCFVEMSYRGLPVDPDELTRVLDLYREAQKKVLAPWTEIFPSVNPGSPEQVLDALWSKGFEVDSTGDEIIAKLDFPPGKALLKWRSLGTQVTYLEGIQKLMFWGAVRSTYNQMAPAGHGRSSSSEPNLQNSANLDEHPDWKELGLPSTRSIFRAPPGKKLIVGDISQAFARIATECSQDPVLIESYRQDKDMHCVTATVLAKYEGNDWPPDQIWEWKETDGHPRQSVAKKLRQRGKTAFYKSLNLGGAVTEEEKEAQKAWKETFCVLNAYQHEQIDKANASRCQVLPGYSDHGVVRSLDGGRLFLEILPTKKGWKPGVKGTDTVSFTWMRTEGTVIKVAEAEVQKDFDNHPEWDAWLCNLSHDQIDALSSEEYSLEVAKSVQGAIHRCMRALIKCIPVDKLDARPEDLIHDSLSEK